MRVDDPEATLAAAQLATARQYGFTSWRRLVSHVTALYEGEILEAVKRGDQPAVANLLRSRRKLARFAGEYGKTCLHWAAETDQAEIARILLDAGADIEAKTSWGATPLEWAATMGSVRVADLLLSRGAGGFTLITAAGLGKLERVKAIIESEADLSAHRRRCAPDSPNDDWPADSAHIRGDVLSDAMYAAARNGHTQIVEYLLDRGAAVDAKGVFGATALHWAAINGHWNTVLLLLARGASCTIRDARFNSTPEGWAKEGGHLELADALHVQ
ncbi:MAG: ankyrin repeat domain-containing protein [Blastocatellia bacterium]|nr:ankyrin repeat domain-containing protein [Blastocatellia bacterium]